MLGVLEPTRVTLLTHFVLPRHRVTLSHSLLNKQHDQPAGQSMSSHSSSCGASRTTSLQLQKSSTASHVEPEQQHVPLLDDVLLAL